MTTIIPPSDYSPEIVKISLRGEFVSLMPGGVCLCVKGACACREEPMGDFEKRARLLRRRVAGTETW